MHSALERGGSNSDRCATRVLGQCVGRPQYTLTDNEKWFNAKFSGFIRRVLSRKLYPTTAYPPRTSQQTERFDKTILRRLWHYVADQRADWDQYLKQLAYSYNKWAHPKTRLKLLNLVVTRHLSSTTVPGAPDPPGTPTRDERLTLVQDRRAAIKRLCSAMQKAGDNQSAAQRMFKKDFDEKVRFQIDVQPRNQV